MIFSNESNLSSAAEPHLAQNFLVQLSLAIDVDNESCKGENRFVNIYERDKYLKRLGRSRIN